jgi:predicted NBD/HSP70 family sugar kinase
MSGRLLSLVKPKIKLPLDDNFRPAVLWNHYFLDEVRKSKKSVPLLIAVENGDDSVLVYSTQVFSSEPDFASSNYFYVEQLIKTLLWIYGGYKITIDGPEEIGKYIKRLYSTEGKRSFDANFMSGIYEKPFMVEINRSGKITPDIEKSVSLGGHLDGCRIGFDLGASDRKVSAVIDGEAVFSEEVVWSPSSQTNPSYHYNEIMSMLYRAAARMPRVQAIGGSSAGIYINNRVMSASLFRGIPADVFDKKVKNIFLDIQKKWDVPFTVINDGEVTALAGSMLLKKNAVLGIAMGSSEAGGYINIKGNINAWLNELAFVPVDFHNEAPIDEWSGDRGCGVQYFSQIAAIRLAESAGIVFDREQTPAEKLKSIQGLMARGDERARKVFETIGCYLGYGIAYYAQFYEIGTVLVLGRVTLGEGGQIVLQKAKQVLDEEFQELSSNVALHLPDESSRRAGQSIAAASLPLING